MEWNYKKGSEIGICDTETEISHIPGNDTYLQRFGGLTRARIPSCVHSLRINVRWFNCTQVTNFCMLKAFHLRSERNDDKRRSSSLSEGTMG